MINHNIKNNEDFYINKNGLIVFTKKYHLKRGTCCKSNCLHCPYKTYKNNNNEKIS